MSRIKHVPVRPVLYAAVAAASLGASSVGATEISANVRPFGDAVSTAPLYTTVDSPANHTVTPPTIYDGVAELILNRTDGTFRCSGALLNGGTQILTAAHCVTNPSGGAINTNIGPSTNAIFHLQAGNISVGISSISVAPGWDGVFQKGNDLAILTLTNAAPADADRYGIYTGSSEIGSVGNKAGYGRTGTGLTGDTIPSGTLHTGENLYETTSAFFTGAIGFPGTGLVYDFDDGNAAHDAFGFFFGMNDLGLGLDEVLAAPGDSGGPTFIGGLIAGITSYGFNLTYNTPCPPQGCTSDINGNLDSSFGEFGVDTQVSLFQSYIDSMTGHIPEPATGVLFLFGAAGMTIFRRKRQAAL